MASALNACGYDEGLDESAPVRKHVREEMNDALARSEDARDKRDKVCLYIAQHRMTGGEKDISQYISLALYLTPPPDMETSADLTEMPPTRRRWWRLWRCSRILWLRWTCTGSGLRCDPCTSGRRTGCTIRFRT